MVRLSYRARVLWGLAAMFAVATVLVSLVIVNTAGGSDRGGPPLSVVVSGPGDATAPVDPSAMRNSPVSPERRLADAVLTDDGGPRFGLRPAGAAGLAVTKQGADRADNTREVFWDEAVAPTSDQLSCATWSDQAGVHDQQGAALRIQPTPAGTRAITVTKSVYYVGWTFNVHLWDPARSGELPDTLAQFEVPSLRGPGGVGVQPLPWRLCARVRGRRLEFVAWKLSDPRPDWGDARHGGAVDLPAGWDGPGRAGWYVGHLHTGDEVVYDDLRAGGADGEAAPPLH